MCSHPDHPEISPFPRGALLELDASRGYQSPDQPPSSSPSCNFCSIEMRDSYRVDSKSCGNPISQILKGAWPLNVNVCPKELTQETQLVKHELTPSQHTVLLSDLM